MLKGYDQKFFKFSKCGKGVVPFSRMGKVWSITGYLPRLLGSDQWDYIIHLLTL